MKTKVKSLFFLAALGSFTLTAQTQSNELPGDTSLPSSKEELAKIAHFDTGEYSYKVEDYFAKPKTSSFQFSPNGKYFSYREKDANGKRHVYVKDTETNEVKKAIEEDDELISGYGWANNNRLIYVKDQGGNENFQLFAANLDGSNNKALTPFKDVNVGLLNGLREQPDYMIIQMNKENKQVFEPYKININTGELEKLYENKDISSPIANYLFDKDGNLRGYLKRVDGTQLQLYYRTSQQSPFEVIMITDWKDSFNIISFDYATSNPHDVFVSTNIGSNTNRIIKYDLQKKQILQEIYQNDTYDVRGLSISRKRGYEIDFYAYEGEKSVIIPVSDTYKKLHEKLKKQFSGKEFGISDTTDDEDKLLISVGSDKLFGEYYIYDVAKDEFKKLLNLMPQLKEEDMAEMRPITYKTRDGFTIRGYITLPKDAVTGKKVPLIINPHGGPYGIRDSWGFNPEAQLFASRGYATLQVNYRGSGGYGKELYLAGSKQIGRKMLNDLEDAVAFVIQQGWVNPKKVAIYGASYGGLATLGSLVKTPDLYTCGVDYVGVSNLFTFVDSFPAYWKPLMKQFYEQWYDPEKPEEKEIMKQVSPALNVDKITKPLLVVQGANDPRVNINESDQIVKSMRARGINVPYMVKYNEGHGFGHEENKIELYKTMLGFFAKHLK